MNCYNYLKVKAEVMKAANKHYKFINSQTGNAIHYHTLDSDIAENDIKAELDKVKAQVATKTGLFVDIIYWEEDNSDK